MAASGVLPDAETSLALVDQLVGLLLEGLEVFAGDAEVVERDGVDLHHLRHDAQVVLDLALAGATERFVVLELLLRGLVVVLEEGVPALELADVVGERGDALLLGERPVFQSPIIGAWHGPPR